MSVPPKSDVVEVTVLGKSFGESIVIHLGDGVWAVVDSLLDEKGKSAPLAYLEALGVDIAASVQLVVVTHWHGDHIAGISQVAEAAPSARIALPGAFDNEKFRTYTKSCLDLPNVDPSPLREIVRLGELIRQEGRPAPVYASMAKPLLTLPSEGSSHGYLVSLTALSPSDRDVHEFFLRLTDLTPGAGAKRPVAFEENENSIAAWLKFGNDAVLLGADLEVTTANDRGWDAVIASADRPQGRASAYKVAHHGSQTGHHPSIWSDLLTDPVIAVIAPWSKNKGLPTRAGQKEILSLAAKSYITAQVSLRKFKGQPGQNSALEKLGIIVANTNQMVGAIRLRKAIDAAAGEWELDLQNGAIHLKEYVAKS